jgi:ankyrin repeat protein
MPLHLASKYGYLVTAQLLLNHGADVNALDNNKMTPLHVASKYKHLNIVQLLLHDGANHDAQEKNAQTALHLVFTEQPEYVLCCFQFQFR